MSSSEIKVKVGNNLKKILDEKGMSQAELARLTDIPKSAITQYIKGMFLPKMPNMSKIAAALGVNVGDILDSIDVFDYLDESSPSEMGCNYMNPGKDEPSIIEVAVNSASIALMKKGYVFGETDNKKIPLLQMPDGNGIMRLKQVASLRCELVALAYTVSKHSDFSMHDLQETTRMLSGLSELDTMPPKMENTVVEIIIRLIELINLAKSKNLPADERGFEALLAMKHLIEYTMSNLEDEEDAK